MAPGSVGVAEVATRLAAGDVVTVSTLPAGPPGAAGPASAGGLVGQHAYAVLAADVAGGRLLLRNPWGSPGVELTRWYRWDELRPHLRAVTLTPTS